MKSFHRTRSAGFTLVEIMLVVAILTLMAAIAIPSHLRARKRSQATLLRDDLRILDHAIDIYSLEFHKAGDEPLTLTSLIYMQKYIKKDTQLYSSLPLDLLGNSFVVTNLSTPPKLNPTSFDALSDVAPADFWSPYYP